MENSTASKSHPEYGKLKNFWEAKSDSGGNTRSNGAVNGGISKKSESCLVSKTASNFASGMAEEDVAPSVIEFDQEIIGCLGDFLKAAQTVGGEAAEHASMVQKAFMAQRNFLATATKFAKPGDAEFQNMLGATATAIQDIQRFRESRRSSPVFNHLSAVSESIPALAWVTITPTPAPYIKEMNDAGQFYTNRVLKDFKDKPGHADWARAWVSLLSTLQTYVKKNHTTGLVWGKKPMAGGGPAPPPPPPPPAFEMPDLTSDMAATNLADNRAQLFAELNKGEDVTKGLKKVTADMQTHKNPNLRSGGFVQTSQKPVTNGSGPGKAPTSKPPKFELDGKKWIVEYHTGNRDLKIENAEMNQVVYVYACKESTIQVRGKINSIVVDSCVKSAVVFDSLVSSVEFVNCRDCQMQVMGTVPTITVDKVDGLQMFLSKDSLQVEIVSAKSSALNVMVPKDDGEFGEFPIPEQFKTTVTKTGLTTVPTETVGV